MAAHQIDQVVRTLGQGICPREVLGVVAEGAGIGVGEVAAKRRERGSGETLYGDFPFSTCYPRDSDDRVAVTGRGSLFCAATSGFFRPCQESNT